MMPESVPEQSRTGPLFGLQWTISTIIRKRLLCIHLVMDEHTIYASYTFSLRLVDTLTTSGSFTSLFIGLKSCRFLIALVKILSMCSHRRLF